MKRIVISVLVILAVLSCCGKGEYNGVKLRSGDLLFVSAAAPDTLSMAEAISTATGEIIHVAIVECCPDGIWTIDATGDRGVDRHPIDTLVADFTLPDGTPPHIEFKRLKDNSKAMEYISRAKTFLDLPYDWHFAQGDEAFYCSELVWRAYEGVFPLHPMNFKAPDGTMPAFWQELFDSFGENVPQDAPGTSPQGIFDDPALVGIR